MTPVPSAPPVLHLPSTTSTQDLAHAHAAQGAPHGWMAVADEQTGGRGSRGRVWHAPVGGAWVSVVVRPTSAAGVAVLSLRVGLVVAEALEKGMEDGSAPLKIKWPNDLMVGTRKLGGILCEARWQGEHPAWVAVGVGMNVHNRVPRDVDPPAVRLADLASGVPSAGEMARHLGRIVASISPAAGLLDDGELARFAARDWLWGRDVAGTFAGRGRAAGVLPDGRLRVLVTGPDGEERVSGISAPVTTGP